MDQVMKCYDSGYQTIPIEIVDTCMRVIRDTVLYFSVRVVSILHMRCANDTRCASSRNVNAIRDRKGRGTPTSRRLRQPPSVRRRRRTLTREPCYLLKVKLSLWRKF